MAKTYTVPSAPPARFDEFMQKSKSLEGVRLTDAIPKSSTSRAYGAAFSASW
jgi:omega-6 fatty acid desaturase (delta-12 desaturase)